MSKSIKEIAIIAAGWWDNVITNPKFDNGTGGMASVAMMNTENVSKESKEKFIQLLCENIEKNVPDTKVESGGYVRTYVLDVDYDPCVALSKICEEAGISSMNFPWKTIMWINKNHIAVRYGYNGKTELLYSNKEYYKYLIRRAEEDLEEEVKIKDISLIESEILRCKELLEKAEE